MYTKNSVIAMGDLFQFNRSFANFELILKPCHQTKTVVRLTVRKSLSYKCQTNTLFIHLHVPVQRILKQFSHLFFLPIKAHAAFIPFEQSTPTQQRKIRIHFPPRTHYGIQQMKLFIVLSGQNE